MPSTYTNWQSDGDFDRDVGYRRIDDLLPTFGAEKGTSNLLDEDENEVVVEEEDVGANEEVTDGVGRFVSDPNPIWQSGQDGSKIVFF